MRIPIYTHHFYSENVYKANLTVSIISKIFRIDWEIYIPYFQAFIEFCIFD